MTRAFKCSALVFAATICSATALATPITVTSDITFDFSVIDFGTGDLVNLNTFELQVNAQGDAMTVVNDPFNLPKIQFVPDGGTATTIHDFADGIVLPNGQANSTNFFFDAKLAADKVFISGDSSGSNGPLFYVAEASTTGAATEVILQEGFLIPDTGVRLSLPRQIDASSDGNFVGILSSAQAKDNLVIQDLSTGDFTKAGIDTNQLRIVNNSLDVGNDGKAVAILKTDSSFLPTSVVQTEGTAVDTIIELGEEAPGGANTYTNFFRAARDEDSGDRFFSHQLSNGELGITRVDDTGTFDIVFDPTIFGGNVSSIGDMGVSNVGPIFEITDQEFNNYFNMVDSVGEVHTIIETGDTVNIDGTDQTVMGLSLFDGGVSGDFFTATVTARDEAGVVSNIAARFELQVTGPGTLDPTADLTGSEFVYDATNLVVSLTSAASRDQDDVGGNEPPDNGISSTLISVQDLDDPFGPPSFITSDRTADVDILNSGLDSTLDVSQVVLNVFDNEFETDETRADLTYRNTEPVILFVTASDVGNSVSFAAVLEDPDLALNEIISNFDFIRASLEFSNGDFLRSSTLAGRFDVVNVLDFLVPKNELSEGGGITRELKVIPSDLAGEVNQNGVTFNLDLDTFTETIGLALFMNTGSPVSVSQGNIDTPTDPFGFQFDYLFTDGEGVLEVFLNDTVVLSLNGADFPNDLFSTAFVSIDGDLLGLIDATLTFTFDGPAGLELLIDNIVFPDLINGDFNNGVIDGWQIETTGASAAGVREFALDPQVSTGVPEPGTLTLFGLGIAGLGYWRRRRKAA